MGAHRDLHFLTHSSPTRRVSDLSRIANWDIRILDTIADNASSGLFVLGAVPRKLDGLDLRACGMVMECRGEPVSVGAGVACLGRSEEHTSELQSLMRISYAVLCLKKKMNKRE